jgi:gamma-glutamyl hercynylcysteine S-oxide synthase
MPDEGILARNLDKAALDGALAGARRQTLAIFADFDAARWNVPELAGINPPLWEFGHLNWFAEWWILRGAGPDGNGGTRAVRASLLEGADRWFDSGRVAHNTRWQLDLPSVSEIHDYAGEVLERVRNRLANEPDEPAALYPYRLALFHEDMHGEALTYMRQTLAYPAHFSAQLPAVDENAGDVALAGGNFTMGLADGAGFAFDNEMDRHDVAIAPFTIARECVSNRAYAKFVEAGGYRDQRLWSVEGLAWLRGRGLAHPALWRKSAASNSRWEHQWFGLWQPLPAEQPVCHVSAYEAEAFCAWAGRRLPGEAEWEYAASSGALRWGDAVWEWLADPFMPYTGFAPGIYREYSEPWFHTHRCVRGASFATRARMRHPRYRNFYTPERNDIFVGFRTCRVGA